MGHPRAARAPCREIIMDGQVSPMRLKIPKATDSIPEVEPDSRPTRLRASLMIGPLAPASKVRSRSKIAAPVFAAGALLEPFCDICISRQYCRTAQIA
jgi:hypothetical protein